MDAEERVVIELITRSKDSDTINFLDANSGR